MTLTGILSEITQARLGGVLLEREPEVLEEGDPDLLARFEALVRGAAVQVVLLTGRDPIAGAVRDLAVEAIALETASAIEYASYPEQQVAGDTGRGYYLHQRYLSLLAQLGSIINNAGGIVPPDGAVITTSGLPRGRFPRPEPYPDPVALRGYGPGCRPQSDGRPANW